MILPDFFPSFLLEYLALQREIISTRPMPQKKEKKETKNAHFDKKWGGKSMCRLPYREQTSHVKFCIIKSAHIKLDYGV